MSSRSATQVDRGKSKIYSNGKHRNISCRGIDKSPLFGDPMARGIWGQRDHNDLPIYADIRDVIISVSTSNECQLHDFLFFVCDFISICSGINYISTQWIHVWFWFCIRIPGMYSFVHFMSSQTPVTIHETREFDTIDARIKLNLDHLWLISWLICISTNMYIYHWH